MQIIFLSGTKCLWLAQYVNNFLLQQKKCGPTQNILWPVEGQGISLFNLYEILSTYLTLQVCTWEIMHYVIFLFLFRQSPGQLPYGYVPLKYLRLGLFDA